MRPETYTKIPSYCRQKSRGIAYVELNGHRHYIPGPYGSPQSRAEYDRLISLWTLHGRRTPAVAAPLTALTMPTSPTTSWVFTDLTGCTVAALMDAYLPYAAGYYVKDGEPTSQLFMIKNALKVLFALFADTPVSQFGPLKLGLVRDAMIQKG